MQRSSKQIEAPTVTEKFRKIFSFYSEYLFCESYQLILPARIACSSNSFTRLHQDQILIYHYNQTHILSIPFPLLGLMGPIVEKLPPLSHNWAEKILALLRDRKEIQQWYRFEDWYLVDSPVETIQKDLKLATESLPLISIQDPELPPECYEIDISNMRQEINQANLKEYLSKYNILRMKLIKTNAELAQDLNTLGFEKLFTWEIIQINL